MAHAGSPLSTSSNGGGAGGNGWYMPGQSQSSYVSFLFVFFVFHEANERRTEPRNTHSQHQTPTPIINNTPPFVLSSSQDMHHHLPPLYHAHSHSHHTHSHSLPKGLDMQAVNLMGSLLMMLCLAKIKLSK